MLPDLCCGAAKHHGRLLPHEMSYDRSTPVNDWVEMLEKSLIFGKAQVSVPNNDLLILLRACDSTP